MKIWIDIVFLIILYFFIFYKKWKKQGKDILLVNTLMYIYLVLLLRVTLMPVLTSLAFVFNHPYHPMNLEPFAGVMNNRGNFVRQVGLNVVLTTPFGFLFPLTQKRNKNNLFLKTVLSTFLLSLCIELLQPLLNGFRVGDITDLITNTTGGAIGCTLYIMFKPVINRVLKLVNN